MRTSEGYWANPWTSEEIAYLRDRYSVIKTQEIADHLGRSYSAVIQRAKIEGFKSRQQLAKHSLVPDYFRVIDTPTKAYLLGLLAADGCVSAKNQVILGLHQKDIQLVELLRDELAPQARIGLYQTVTTPMARFLVTSPDLAADLARHGVVKNKTLTVHWPREVPEELENSFICGYFDGDGSLYTQVEKQPYRWTIVCGAPDFLREIQAKVLIHTGVKVGGPYQDKRTGHAWSIVTTGEPVRVLDEWIHRDVPGLDRKCLAQVLKRTE